MHEIFISYDDLLQPGPEPAAGPPDVLPQEDREHLHDVGHQRCLGVMGGSVYTPFSDAPRKIIQKIQIWGARRPRPP